MSLVQGGPGPLCFPSWVFDYGFESVQVGVEDVLTDSVKNFLQKVATIYIEVLCVCAISVLAARGC